MASALGYVPILLLLVALFLVPPAISLVAALRRMAELAAKGLRPVWLRVWLRAGAAFSGLAFAANLALIIYSGLATGGGAPHLDGGLAVAAFLSWASFWNWIAVLTLHRGKRRRRRY